MSWGCGCCEDGNQFVDVTIPVDCVVADIDVNGNIISQHPNTPIQVVSATWSTGSGNNGGLGNRMTITLSGTPPANLYVGGIVPYGLPSGTTPNGVIPHIVSIVGNDVTYVFNSGDDGQSLDEFDRFRHHITLKGCSETLTKIQ